MKKLFTTLSFFKTKEKMLLFSVLALLSQNVYGQFPAPYCNVTFDYDVEPITSVIFAGINNQTSATINGTPAVENFLSIQGNVTPGLSYTCTVKGNTGGAWTDYIRVYIDWNQNNNFNDPGESYNIGSIYNSSGTNATQASATIAVPGAAMLGNTRMRVFKDYDDYPPTPCSSNYGFGQVEDYTIVVTAATGCSTATFPASATTQASPANICVSGNVTLGITPVTAMPSASGITYQWQSSPTGAAPWTNIGTPTTTPVFTTNISTSSYFRCQVLCNGGASSLASSASSVVTVNNPGSATGIPASRCGPGSVTLGATPPSGSTINWFQNTTGGASLGTGNSYNTGYIPATTTFYAAATAGTTPATQWVGTGASTSSEPFIPYYDYYFGDKVQYLIRASELIAAGFAAGTINSIGFDVTSVTSNFPLSSFSIAMKQTTLTELTTTFETGLLPVYTNANYQPLANSVNTHTLTAGFPWDGTSNIVIEVCHNNSGYNMSGPAVSVKYTNYGYNATHYDYDDNSAQCASPSGFYYGTTTSRPNMQLNMTLPCMGPRVPVVATITAPPAVTKVFPAVVCNNAITPISIASSPMSNYTNYTWTPVTDNLYTDGAATVPYTTGSAPTVYMKSDVVGQNTYYLYATGATPAACAFADTVKIWVQPEEVTIKAEPDSICVTGTSTLSLIPNTGYAPGSIQWLESETGLAGSYNIITSATGVTYTTPTLTAQHYYKALIKSTKDTCMSPEKRIVVVNPTLLGATDSFNCGPGSVTLRAETGGFSTARWYTTPTGGTPVGSGSPWNTPYQANTQTYYVAAEGGSGGGASVTVQVGTATTTAGGSNAGGNVPGPFSIYYGRSTMQFLYTAAEITAAGGNPGNITSLAFNCTNVPGYAILNYTVSVKFVPSSMNTLTWQTGLVPVYNTVSFQPSTTGWKTFPFTANQSWNGTDNIVVQLCWNQTDPEWNASGNHQYTNKTGRFLYAWDDDAVGSTSCGLTGTATSNNLPNVRFGMQEPCQTPRQAVMAYIHPKPVVDLGPDIDKCVDAGAVEVLDAGVQPNTPQFLWDNGSAIQVRAVTQSGTYSVRVTNQYTCYSDDDVVVVLRRNPVVQLGNDTTVCNGVTLPLNAGPDGIDYFWSTGQTTPVINITAAGSYNVFVTNSLGCIKTDTIVVNMAGELPTVQGINVSNNGINTFHFTSVNPQNVVGYDWDFGDNTPHSYQAAPTHTYANAGNYIVTLKLSSSCGFLSDSTSAHIVGIHQLNVGNDELTVYPNPAKGTATILNKGALKMESVSVYNILGQVVYKAVADNNEKHILQLNGLASGVYTIQVFTDKGTVARKLEVVR